MTEPPTLTLYSNSLCSKFGFNDGDSPEHLLDYWDEIDLDYSDVGWHDALRHLVRTHLIPAMEAAGHTVVVYDIETNHNPIRAERIDGVTIDDYEGAPFELQPERVHIPYAAIADACGIAATA